MIGYFEQNFYFFLFAVLLFGLVFGSFLNVVIHRLPRMMEHEWRHQCREFLELESTASAEQDSTYNLITPNSQCPKCGHKIGALENIPVISYLIQRGKCRGCGAAISLRYPIVELITALSSVVVALHFGPTPATLFALPLTWALIALSFIDIDKQLLPDSITLPFLWLGLLASLFGVFVNATTAIIGAMCGYLSLWVIFKLFKYLTGKEGMGYGDFKLLALFGAWLGWQSLPLVILLSSVVGAVVGISMIAIRGQDRNIPIPFGPYLAAAGWITLLWGQQITSFYLDWASPSY